MVVCLCFLLHRAEASGGGSSRAWLLVHASPESLMASDSHGLRVAYVSWDLPLCPVVSWLKLQSLNLLHREHKSHGWVVKYLAMRQKLLPWSAHCSGSCKSCFYRRIQSFIQRPSSKECCSPELCLVELPGHVQPRSALLVTTSHRKMFQGFVLAEASSSDSTNPAWGRTLGDLCAAAIVLSAPFPGKCVSHQRIPFDSAVEIKVSLFWMDRPC